MNTSALAKQFAKFRVENPKIQLTKKEEIMSKDKEKRPCESCGQVKPLNSHLGKLVCPSCSGMRGVINQRPQVVVDALREMMGSLCQFLTADEWRQAEERGKNDGPVFRGEDPVPGTKIISMEGKELIQGLQEQLIARDTELTEARGEISSLGEDIQEYIATVKELRELIGSMSRTNMELIR